MATGRLGRTFNSLAKCQFPQMEVHKKPFKRKVAFHVGFGHFHVCYSRVKTNTAPTEVSQKQMFKHMDGLRFLDLELHSAFHAGRLSTSEEEEEELPAAADATSKRRTSTSSRCKDLPTHPVGLVGEPLWFKGKPKGNNWILTHPPICR